MGEVIPFRPRAPKEAPPEPQIYVITVVGYQPAAQPELHHSDIASNVTVGACLSEDEARNMGLELFGTAYPKAVVRHCEAFSVDLGKLEEALAFMRSTLL